MSYQKLLNDLEALQKSYNAADEDDKKIQAAAEGDDDEKEELDADGKPVAKEKPDDEDKEKPFAKSFTGTTEEGEPFEAVDATELIKSLNDKIEVLEKGAVAEKSDLTKSLTILAGVIKAQGNLIKSLQENYLALANQGRGRKSIITPPDDMAKSLEADQLTAETFMLKANAAYSAGRISGKDLTVCDVSLRQGAEIDQSLFNKIMAS